MAAATQADAAHFDLEQTFNQLLDALPVLFAYVGRDQRYRLTNKAYDDWFRRARGELHGRHVKEVLGDEAYAALKSYVDSALGGKAVSFERLVPFKDGDRHVDANLIPQFGDDGEVRGFFVLVSDITERKQAERALLESEERFRGLIEGSIQGIHVHRGGKPLFANQALADIFGYDSPSEILELDSIIELAAPEERPRLWGYAHARLRGEEAPTRLEYQGVHKDGSIIWVQSIVRVVTWGGERAIQATIFDITERKQAEEDLRASEKRYRTVSELTTDLVYAYLVAPDGAMTLEWSAGSQIGQAELHPLSDADPKGCWHPYVIAEDQPILRERQQRLLAAEQSTDEFRITDAKGTVRWMHAIGKPEIDGAGHVVRVIGAAQDITERKQAEQALREAHDTLEQRVRERTFALEEANKALHDQIAERERAEAALRQSQKLEAIGQLTGGVAHEFNNLLTVVLGNLDILEDDIASEDSDTRELIQTIRGGALRGAGLTKRLLAFSREQRLDAQPFDLGDLLAGMRELLRGALEETVTLELDINADVWMTEADVGQMENAILNLVLNARDAMFGDGRITMRLRNVALGADQVAGHRDAVPGDYVELTVTDTGTGMAPHVVEHAFDPFFTTKEVGKGTGLGLSTIYGFVKQSGGFTEIESEVGKGTTVALFLPRSMRPRRAVEGEQRSGDWHPAGHETILVVEDDAEVRRLTASLLAGLGYRIVEAKDGKSALAAMDSGQSIDLLFTDVVMPGGVSGIELAEACRGKQPGLKVIFTSGYNDETISQKGKIGEGVRLIQKPFRKKELAQALCEALSGGVAHPRPKDASVPPAGTEVPGAAGMEELDGRSR